MVCVSAHTNNRVFAKDFSREVSHPYVIASYPPTLDVRDVLKSSSTYGSVESHQVFQQSGQVMVKYQALESAATAYRATMPGPIYFSSGNSSQDLVMSLADRLERVQLITFPQPALTGATSPPPHLHCQVFRYQTSPLPHTPPACHRPRHPRHPFYRPYDHVPDDYTSTPRLLESVRFTPSAPHPPHAVGLSRPRLTRFLQLHGIRPTPTAHTTNVLHALLHTHSYTMQVHQHITAVCVGTHRLFLHAQCRRTHLPIGHIPTIGDYHNTPTCPPSCTQSATMPDNKSIKYPSHAMHMAVCSPYNRLHALTTFVGFL